MTEGKLIRRLLPFERNFTQLPNSWIRDSRLSLKARGLLALLMSHNDGWSVTVKALAADSRADGEHAIATARDELVEYGYLIRRPRRGTGRFTAEDWELVDPSGLSDPALIGYMLDVDNSGGENRQRSRSGGENRQRTGGENRHPLRTPVEDIEAPSASHVRGPSYPQAVPVRECPVSPRVSPSGRHERTTNGVCVNCGDELPKAISA
jgi:hypothetical protein